MIVSPESIKAKTLDICEICKDSPLARGLLDNEGVIEDCECAKTYSRYLRYSKANIDEDFWDFKWEDLEDKFRRENKNVLDDILLYSKHRKEYLENCVPLLFTGGNGTGKTIISYLLAKDLLDDDYKGMYICAEDLGEKLFLQNRDPDIREEVSLIKEGLDFLIVDEIQQFTGSNAEILNKLSNFLSNQLKTCSVFFISNKKVSDLKMLGYSNNFIDRLKGIEEMEFKGKSFRQTFESKFRTLKESLKDK